MTDGERATLFLYVQQIGLPPWAEKEGGQADILSKLAGWPVERAAKALETARLSGYATKDVDDAAVPV